MPHCSPVQTYPVSYSSCCYTSKIWASSVTHSHKLQFIHALGLTPPFPSHHTRITAPGMNYMNQKIKQSKYWYQDSWNSVWQRQGCQNRSLLLCSHTAHPGVHKGDTQCCGTSLAGPHWEARFATAHSAAEARPHSTLLSNTFLLFLAYSSPTFPCLSKQSSSSVSREPVTSCCWGPHKRWHSHLLVLYPTRDCSCVPLS